MNTTNFWEELKKVDFTSKKNLDIFLQEQLGSPLDQIQTNLLKELSKKIFSYYAEEQENNTIFHLTGTVEAISDIIEKKSKEGKRMGQTFYVLILKAENERLQARQENLEPKKWEQIQKFAILGQKLVFKYKNWITNKCIIDFYPYENNEVKKEEGDNTSKDSLQSKLDEKNTGSSG